MCCRKKVAGEGWNVVRGSARTAKIGDISSLTILLGKVPMMGKGIGDKFRIDWISNH